MKMNFPFTFLPLYFTFTLLFTAFEANGQLNQYKQLPFGVTNGVPCFQYNIDGFIAKHKLKKKLAYLDNITVFGMDQNEHDVNLQKLLAASKTNNLKLNDDKSIFSQSSICLLGYQISNNEIRPDPSRLQPLRDIPPPQNARLQKRTVGLFASYAKGIRNFSKKIKPLSSNTSFLLPKPDSVVATINEYLTFVVETDVSDFAIAATLNQEGRPVAFFSRTLQSNELNHPSGERAYSIIESIRH